jgi:CDP-paratose 2-epimerase
VLHVDDLLNAYDLAIAKIDIAKGQVYNMGGGVGNVLAIWSEFGPMIERLLGKKMEVARGDWRPGDQKVFYADYRKAERELGWKPQINLEDGIERLFQWVQENKEQF